MEYEKKLMKRELKTLFPFSYVEINNKETRVKNIAPDESNKLKGLTFYKEYEIDGTWHNTYQGAIEKDDTLRGNKQHTRYSTHGIHEYKGKFNPQIVHCMINLFGLNTESVVLDPFNGSGTTTLECAHLGIKAKGMDINPMACFIANAKIKALTINAEESRKELARLVADINEKGNSIKLEETDRTTYLKKWIPEGTLQILEYIRERTSQLEGPLSALILTVASDLIREYSYQEPSDLRIRRRKAPLPETPYIEAFNNNMTRYIRKIEEAQACIHDFETSNSAIHCDVKHDNPFSEFKFDAALTSPPYVTALPYIDTQRISLVWLGLCEAKEIGALESTLIGSRELLKKEKDSWTQKVQNNEAELPDSMLSLVHEMKNSLADSDGFRRQAVPELLYRYLSEMKDMFINVHSMLKDNAPYALIVGHNKTTLGGKEFLIDTPALLAELARECGWSVEEIIPLETYKRYGINSKNAINEESMVILRKSPF